MKHRFTCPNCQTRFAVDVPDHIRVVMCPACGKAIPLAVDEIGSLGDNIRQAATREGNWILWAAAAFAAIWGLVVVAMVMSNRKPAVASAPPAPVTSAPPAPAPVYAPAPPPTPTPLPTPAPAPPPPTPVPAPHEVLAIVPHRAALSDADIVTAIHKGTDFLLSNFVGGELNPKTDDVPERYGLDALAVYALLHCSQSTRDDRIGVNSPAMKEMIEHLKRFPLNAGEAGNGPVTYSRSLRASALSIYNRQEDRDTLQNDLEWLLRAEQDGAYGYDDDFIRPGQKPPTKPTPGVHSPDNFSWDNSNSQYGLIGVWSCAEAGLSVPNKYWLDVERHWAASQAPNGTWGYHQGDSNSYSMTMAGITALSVCRDFMLEAPAQSSPGRIAPPSAALTRALQWFDTGDNSVNVSGPFYTYSLYGLERAVLSSGMTFAGTHDIYREVAKKTVQAQLPNGAWEGSEGRGGVIGTSFSLLFLARGRNPVLMNKLRYNGNWANHQRDAANLSRYASYAIERPVNWQIATLFEPWAEWMESPILLISGDVPPNFGPADYERLRNYVENGGLIVTNSDGGSMAFTAFVHDLATKLFPKYEMSAVPDDDDLFSLQFHIPDPHPRVMAVSNGSRKLLIHFPDDLAGQWQSANLNQNMAGFEMGLNLFVYATGKAELRTKTDSPYIFPPEEAPGKYVPVARVQYAGNWDPEPGAWPRFMRYFWWETGWTLQPATVQAADLKFSNFPVAHLTGTTTDPPGEATATALRQFVADGGTLFIDCCGGSPGFDAALKNSWLPAICPNSSTQFLADDDPILTGKIPNLSQGSSDLSRILLRPYAAQVSKPANTHLMEIRSGKGRVIYTEIDVTTGLLGTNTWGITGYSPAYAEALLKNVILDAVADDQRGK